MAQMEPRKWGYGYDIALSTADLAVTYKYDKILGKYIHTPGGYESYRDSYFTLIDNNLKYQPLQVSCYSQRPKSVEVCRFWMRHQFYAMLLIGIHELSVIETSVSKWSV